MKTMDSTPPSDTGAERAVIGSIVLAPELVPEFAGWLRPGDFYDTRNAAVFGACLALWEERAKGDIVTVVAKLGNRDMEAFIAGIVRDTPIATNAAHYARIVKDKALARGIIRATAKAESLARAGGATATDILAETRRDLDALDTGEEALFSTMPDLADTALATCSDPGATIRTQLGRLDEAIGSMRPGQLVLVGARPGAGKTALATRLAINAASQGFASVLATYEMAPSDLWVRMACSERGLSVQGVLAGGSIEALRDARASLDTLPIKVAHAPRMHLSRLFAACRRVRASFVVVDYLQLVPMPEADTRERQVAEASRTCKLAAQELGIPVVVCVQLNRGVEHRGPDAKPRLSDLRESGALEQDADIVILMDREELRADAMRNVRQGVIDVSVAKNRNGPLARFGLGFDGPCMNVRDL